MTMETPSGAQATYHNIGKVTMDFTRRQMDFVVTTYLSREARLANKYPLDNLSYSVAGTDFPVVDADPRKAAYTIIKASRTFKDAVDVLEAVDVEVQP
jgi:hypothetical protein